MIVIPKKLRLLVERWLESQDRTREHGGYFFGSESQFWAFLPCPNFSKTPYKEFSRGNGDYFAKAFGQLLELPLVAQTHTHPNGSVASEADRSYIESHGLTYEVIIADMKKSWRWFVINRQLQEVGVVESDDELKHIAFMLAHEVGMTDLGRVFVTPKGELLGTDMAKILLEMDKDAYRVWEHKKKHSWRSKKQMASELNLSRARLNKALVKIEKASTVNHS